MASKEQVQKALDELWVRYGNTLELLTNALDKIDNLEKQLEDSADIDVDLSTPVELQELEKLIQSRTQQNDQG